jgi:hypothetical protein
MALFTTLLLVCGYSFGSVLRIRIRKFLGLLDPDPLVRGTDPDPYQNVMDPEHRLR